jgi:hypothetical protein
MLSLLAMIEPFIGHVGSYNIADISRIGENASNK